MRTTTPIQAVIFDCDGTLVDSETVTCRVMWEIAVQYGFMLDEMALYTACTGSNMARSVDYINSHSLHAMPESYATEVRALQAVRFKESLLEIEGASKVLKHLTQRNIPFAMATNGPRAKAELTLGITRLLPYFQRQPPCGTHQDLLFSAYEHNTFKPLPELFLLAATALGVAPEACAAVEDSVSGLQAGLTAGMQTFSLVPLGHFKERLEPEPTVLPSLAALLDYL